MLTRGAVTVSAICSAVSLTSWGINPTTHRTTSGPSTTGPLLLIGKSCHEMLKASLSKPFLSSNTSGSVTWIDLRPTAHQRGCDLTIHAPLPPSPVVLRPPGARTVRDRSSLLNNWNLLVITCPRTINSYVLCTLVSTFPDSHLAAQ